MEAASTSGRLKLHFPMDQDFEQYLHILSSEHGLIFPLKGVGKSGYHVTAIIRDHGDFLNFNIHLKDELAGTRLYNVTFKFTRDNLSEFFGHVKSVMVGSVLKLLSEARPLSDEENIYLDASGIDESKSLLEAKDSKSAMEAWRELMISTEKNAKKMTPASKMVYHPKEKALLVKLQPNKYISQDRMMEVMHEAFESDPKLRAVFEAFESEMKKLFAIIAALPNQLS